MSYRGWKKFACDMVMQIRNTEVLFINNIDELGGYISTEEICTGYREECTLHVSHSPF